MSELDLSKYEGHTEGRDWLNVTNGVPIFVRLNPEGSDARLIADAPLLLAEVRRLREENAALNGQLEQQLRRSEMAHMKQADREAALRQGHARLLEASAAVVAGIDQWNEGVQKVIGKQPAYRWGGLEELRAAVAEAEALS